MAIGRTFAGRICYAFASLAKVIVARAILVGFALFVGGFVQTLTIGANLAGFAWRFDINAVLAVIECMVIEAGGGCT